ncbi:MAG: methionyl-tRNA formyltransferase [Planctomycetes bacterium]|nr:methionyl-tRNA formyltransferase [Planctomycetota bacterium]
MDAVISDRSMRLVFLASGVFAGPTLSWLAQSRHEVALVITQPARPSGRGRRLTRTHVADLADTLGVETWEIADVNEPEVIAGIRDREARLGVVIAFGQKLGPSLLESLPLGFINLHASLLPKFRGAAPINWAIVRGEEQTGCTIFRVGQRMDAGPILLSRSTPIEPHETAGELHDRLSAIGVEAVRETLDLFAGEAIPPGALQDESQVTQAPKLKKSDGWIDFDRPAREVANRICGLTPWPGATALQGPPSGPQQKVLITRARPVEDLALGSAPPGTIDMRGYVAARDGWVDILEIKPTSGRRMTWDEYVNGRHVVEGDRFLPAQP